MKRGQALAFRHKIEKAASYQDDETALQSIALFPKWNNDMDVLAGERYQYNGRLYRCIQSHHTQFDWTPDITASLYTEVSIEEWPEWVQPLGQQDAYMAGDKVTYSGKHYISLVDYNVWSPDTAPQYWNEVI